MERKHKPIDWSKYPKHVTDFGDTNGNKLDIAIDDIDERVVALDSSKSALSEKKHKITPADVAIFISVLSIIINTIDFILKKL